MIFKFPQKKIVLDCFTTNPEVVEYAPVNFAIKHIPQWWKDLPETYLSEDGFTNRGTMRYCAGMVDYYKKSIAIPLWADFSLKIHNDKNYSWAFSDGKTKATVHPLKNQANGFLETFGHLKIISPWLFKTKESIDWVWSHPTYNYKNASDLTFLPGMTNFYHQHGTNLNIMFPVNKEKLIEMPHGQTMALLTPMSDRKIEIVRHLITDQEFSKIDNTCGIAFVNRLKTIIDKKEQFSNCPFKKG